MRLEDATLSLEPRSVGANIDVAILFYRRHAAKLLFLSLLFGTVPVAIGAWRAPSGSGFLWASVLFLFGSPFLGAAVVAGAGHHVFGEEFTVSSALRQVGRRAGSLLFFFPLLTAIFSALGLVCVGLPYFLLESRYGFLSEVILLEQLKGRRIGKRLEEVSSDFFLNLCGRNAAIASFALLVGLVLFLFADLSAQFLFGLPVLLGRISFSVAFEDFENLISYDPLLVATLSATGWLVYPLARLAWFFTYLDARIRKEGWDVEIAFRVEARRIA
jgi:hypothetical protein